MPGKRIRYIAMLRGINVSGHNMIKMKDLSASFGALRFHNVETCVQSGNVVFETTNDSASKLSKMIEQRIATDFGISVPVFLRRSDEMAAIIKRNPFLKQPAIDNSKLHVTFLSNAPPKAAHELLQPMATKPELFCIIEREIYLYCPNGYGKSKLSNTAIEKKLSIGATTRNWRTVNTLLAMAQ